MPLDEKQFNFFSKQNPANSEEFFEFQHAMDVVADFLTFGNLDSFGLCRNLGLDCLPEFDSYEFGLFIADKMDWVPYGIYKYTRSMKDSTFSHIFIAFDKGICLYVRPSRLILLKRAHSVDFLFYNMFWEKSTRNKPSYKSCCDKETSYKEVLEGQRSSKCLSALTAHRFLCGG